MRQPAVAVLTAAALALSLVACDESDQPPDGDTQNQLGSVRTADDLTADDLTADEVVRFQRYEYKATVPARRLPVGDDTPSTPPAAEQPVAPLSTPLSAAEGMVDAHGRTFIAQHGADGQLVFTSIETETGILVDGPGIRAHIRPEDVQAARKDSENIAFDISKARPIGPMNWPAPAGRVYLSNSALSAAEIYELQTDDGLWHGWVHNGYLIAQEIRSSPSLTWDVFITATFYDWPTTGSITDLIAQYDDSWLGNGEIEPAPYANRNAITPPQCANTWETPSGIVMCSYTQAGSNAVALPFTLRWAVVGSRGAVGLQAAESIAYGAYLVAGALVLNEVGQAIGCLIDASCLTRLARDNVRIWTRQAAILLTTATAAEILRRCGPFEDEARRLQGRPTSSATGVLTFSQACVLAFMCDAYAGLGKLGPSGCDGVDIFVAGYNHVDATAHVADAIFLDDKPAVLRRMGPNIAHPRKWLEKDRRCAARGLLQDCDEYPFASTYEGGKINKPSIRPVYRRHNQGQGSALRHMFTKCGIGSISGSSTSLPGRFTTDSATAPPGSDGEAFIVIATLAMPSMGVCVH